MRAARPHHGIHLEALHQIDGHQRHRLSRPAARRVAERPPAASSGAPITSTSEFERPRRHCVTDVSAATPRDCRGDAPSDRIARSMRGRTRRRARHGHDSPGPAARSTRLACPHELFGDAETTESTTRDGRRSGSCADTSDQSWGSVLAGGRGDVADDRHRSVERAPRRHAQLTSATNPALRR